MELMAAIRALHLAAIALLAGGFAFPLLVLPTHPADVPLEAWLAKLRMGGAVLALLTWLAWLFPVAASMSGLPLADAAHIAVLKLVLVETRFGRVWLIRLVLLIVLACATRRSPWLGLVLTAAVLVSQAWAGHATVGPLSHAAVEAVHGTATALWLGSLAPLLWLLARARAGDPNSVALASRAAHGFSRMGGFAVLGLALTGAFNGVMMVGSVDALFATVYGRLVTAKLVLFVAMLALAAANRFRFTPRLQPSEPQASVAATCLWRSVAAEAALGACIFAIVGALAGSEPAAHERPVDMTMEHK